MGEYDLLTFHTKFFKNNGGVYESASYSNEGLYDLKPFENRPGQNIKI